MTIFEPNLPLRRSRSCRVERLADGAADLLRVEDDLLLAADEGVDGERRAAAAPAPTTAWATPLPAFRAATGRRSAPRRRASFAVHVLEALAAQLDVLADVDGDGVDRRARSLFLTKSLSFSTFFGFFFVPAFVGVTREPRRRASGAWATADRGDCDGEHGDERRDQVLAQESLLLRRSCVRGQGGLPWIADPIRSVGTRRRPSCWRCYRPRRVRAPPDAIPAPPFPRELPWINVAPLRMDKQLGRPVLVEFWDFCRVNSLRTLPYLKAWHERYAGDGLRVIGIHTGGFEPSRDPDAVRAAVDAAGDRVPGRRSTRGSSCGTSTATRAGPRATCGTPGRAVLLHYGEGAYEETEREVQALLGVERDPLAPVRPEDAPGVLLPAQTEDQPGAYSGPYEAGGVWAVLDGPGDAARRRARDRGRRARLPTRSIEHPRHTRGCSTLGSATGVNCHATCFTPARPPARSSACPRSPSRRTSSRRAVVVHADRRVPGQYGDSSGRRRGSAAGRPSEPVLIRRVPAGVVHSARSSRGHGPERCECPQIAHGARRRAGAAPRGSRAARRAAAPRPTGRGRSARSRRG